jgi:exosortase
VKTASSLAAVPEGIRRDLYLFGAALLALWGSFVLEQRYHWGWESYYNYGWTVPIVGVALLFLRWRDAPAPGTLPRWGRRLLAGVIIAGLVLLLPLRLMNEVNVFWRVPFLLQSWILLGVSWAALALVGGRGWFAHFWFPLAFFLTFVPWPYRLEVEVIQGLTGFVTAATVNLLHLVGYPAEVRGNTIVVGSHWLGVDQACSGIRSLQALTMVALWLGEYFRLAWKGRIIVVLGAALLTGVFNLLRATGLTIATFHGGNDAYESWHDPLGFVTFLTSIVLLYFLCEFFGGKVSKKVRETRKAGWSDEGRRPAPRAIAAAMLAVGIGLPLATEGWFRWREESSAARASWTLDLDFSSPRLRQVEIPEKVREVLNYNYGLRCLYEAGLGQELDLYFYGYTGEDKMQSVSSYGHRPDICMTSQGARAIGEEAPLTVEIRPGFELTLRHFKFETPGRNGEEPEFPQVFWLVWERRNMGIEADRLDSLDYRTQLEMLWAGRRDYARQVLLISLRHVHSEAAARRHVRAFLRDHVKVEEPE